MAAYVDPSSYYDVNALNREVGQTAAERAVAGGYAGSPFAANMGNYLRFSEQQKFLQPYLEREQQSNLASAAQAAESARQNAQIQAQAKLSANELASRAALQREAEAAAQAGDERRYAAAMQQLQASAGFDLQKLNLSNQFQTQLQGSENAARMAQLQLTGGQEAARQQAALEAQRANLSTQIAADTAARAIQEAGLDRRLSSENAARLQQAMLTGNIQLQERILSEAGASARTLAELNARHQDLMTTGQQRLQESLLPYAAAGRLDQTALSRVGLPNNLFLPAMPAPAGPVAGFSRLAPSAGYGSQTSNQPQTPMNSVQGILASYGLGGWPGNEGGSTFSESTGSGTYAPRLPVYGPTASYGAANDADYG